MVRIPGMVAMTCALMLIGSGTVAEPFLTTSNGVELPAPNVTVLSCDRMQVLLNAYADSGYREVDPLSPAHPDHAIFMYEDNLARHHYTVCQLRATQFGDAAPAFELGFN
jgi:hypothetical protein